jgi:Zn-dependent M28 family amino/carboxypeptidase
MRSALSTMRGGAAQNSLVLIDESHSGEFARFASFLERPSRTMTPGPGTGPNVLFVLTDDTSPASFSVNATASASRERLANVGAMIPGRRGDEIVVFSAHYDHLGVVRPVDGDSIANGANDDASGTAAVMALARYFSEMEQPERTLMFVAFTAEEIGGYGSRYFSSQLDPDQIVAMFNIEMIGKPAVEGPNTAWITGFDRSDFGEILQRAVEGTVFSFYPDPYPGQNLFFRSDNATLARLGVPAHSISTTPIDVDRDYHQVTDEVETLDMDHLTNTVRAIAAGAVTIVNGSETPTRVAIE